MSVRGMRDGRVVRVRMDVLGLTASATVVCGKLSFQVTPSTPRTISSGCYLFDLPDNQPVVACRVLPASTTHMLARAKRQKVDADLVVSFQTTTQPFQVVYNHDNISHYFVFPADIDAFEQVGSIITCKAPISRWTLTPHTTPPPQPIPPIVYLLLTNTHDAAPGFGTSRDEWIKPSFDAFAQDPAVDTFAFAHLLVIIFASALFLALCPDDPTEPRDPHDTFKQICAKRHNAIRPTHMFLSYLFSPLELNHDIKDLLAIFLPGVEYAKVSVIPQGARFSASVDDTLFVFDCFDLPSAFVASRKYYIHRGFLYAWQSQLTREFRSAMTDTASQVMNRATAKIHHIVFDVFAADLMRNRRTRWVDAPYREWLLYDNPFVKQLSTTFISNTDMSSNLAGPDLLITRMKHGIQTILDKIGSDWRYGKIDTKEMPKTGDFRTAIRICKLKQCISPSCADRPHNSSSHLFFSAFSTPANLPTVMYAYSNASGRHKAAEGRSYGLLATIIIPPNIVTDTVDVRYH